MNAMFISDTQVQHEDVLLPRGNMIIHAGNITKNGTFSEVEAFLQWFAHLNYKYKIFIAGTHDHFFEEFINASVTNDEFKVAYKPVFQWYP